MINKFIYYDYVFSQEDLDIFWKENVSEDWLLADKNNRSMSRQNRDVIMSGTTGFKSSPPMNNIFDSYVESLDLEHKNQFIHGLQKCKGGFYPDEKIARYNIGNDYEWHTDDWVDGIVVNGTQRRQLSTITYLNDDYIGGETEFQTFTIEPKKGKTLIFPSHWEYIHRGKKVIEGVKYVYINHIWF
tara:strand:+ start:46 stop:603 length:558 start_codon:yes stop_codon:yes gene_type:complete